MKFSQLIVASAVAIGAQASIADVTNTMDIRVLQALRSSVNRASSEDASSINFLKFYADNFLWSITELYKSFSKVGDEVYNLRQEVEEQKDTLEDLYDDIDDKKDDWEDKMEELQELLDDMEAIYDSKQADLEAMASSS